MMATYVVHYDARKGSSVGGGTKTVTCETESTAVQIAKDQVLASRPGYTFILKKVEKKK
jgi:hypothetical protein